MRAMWLKQGCAAAVAVAAMLSSGCGEFVRQSQSPSQLVIDEIRTARGTAVVVVPGGPLSAPTVTPTFIAGPLNSRVPNPNELPTQDTAEVRLRVILKDPGAPGSPTEPSTLNAVTITRYTVRYRRLGGPNGQNTPGVDVPQPIDGAATFTVAANQVGTAVVELVRPVAKQEAPLAALASSRVVLTMIAEVTFYGRDQTGNNVSATGSVQINFSSFL